MDLKRVALSLNRKSYGTAERFIDEAMKKKMKWTRIPYDLI
jgi:hypothetical protein